MRKTTLILTLFFSFSFCHAQLEWQELNSVPSDDYYTLHQIINGSPLYVAGANGLHYLTTNFFDNATSVNNTTAETIRDFIFHPVLTIGYVERMAQSKSV